MKRSGSHAATLQRNADAVTAWLKLVKREINQIGEKEDRLADLKQRIQQEQRKAKPNFRLLSELESECRVLEQQTSDNGTEERLEPIFKEGRNLLDDLGSSIMTEGTRLHGELMVEIKRALSPYFEDGNLDYFIRNNSRASLCLWNVAACHWRREIPTNLITAMESALFDADRLLSGKSFWIK